MEINDRHSPVMARFACAEIERKNLPLTEIAAKTGLSVARLKRRLSAGLPNRGNYRAWDAQFIFSLSVALGHDPYYLLAVSEGYEMRDRELRDSS
jgi:hypothetical protein